MTLPGPSDFVRFVSTPETLNVILKNTHFRDGLLNENAHAELSIQYSGDAAILVFYFGEPYYDFSETLRYDDASVKDQGWLTQDKIVIRLMLADSVIADQLTIREFILDEQTSATLRTRLVDISV